ncbi:hypothetical protein CON38_26770, partial [Bacillus cereus]
MKKKVNYKKKLNTNNSRKLLLTAKLLTATCVMIAPFAPNVSNHIPFAQSGVAYADGLTDITILQNTKLTTSNDRPVQKPDGSYDFDLTLSGRALAEVGALDDKKIVFTIPEELRGNITNPTVDISVELLPLQLADVPLLDTTLTGLQKTLDTVNGILTPIGNVPLVGRLVKGLITAITNLTTNINQTIEGLKHLGTYTDSLPGVISNNGSTITVDFDEGLGNYLQKTYAEILSPLVNGLDQFVKDLVNGLPLLGKVLGPVLTPILDTALKPVLALLQGVINGTGDLANALLNARILGENKYTLHATTSDPNVPFSDFHAAAIKGNLINLDLITSGASKQTIHWKDDSD